MATGHPLRRNDLQKMYKVEIMPTYSKEQIDLVAFPSGPLGTNAYLIVCKKTNKAALVDAPPESIIKVVRECEKRGATLDKFILTHSHWDHIAESSLVSLRPYVHTEDAYNLRAPGSDKVNTWMSIEPVEPLGLIKEGDIIHVGESSWKVIHTPGHTPGGICLYSAEEGMLISGDTLFRGSMGRLDIPTGEPERMWNSLKKLSTLPPETRVFPGHGGTTTIGQEGWLSHAEQYFGH